MTIALRPVAGDNGINEEADVKGCGGRGEGDIEEDDGGEARKVKREAQRDSAIAVREGEGRGASGQKIGHFGRYFQ